MILRDRFLAADVGITGANFLIAETGTSIIVTNEGNGDLTQTLPRVHIVLASIEKVVPTLEDVSQLLRVLARSATAQEMSVYTTFSTGPRRAGDPDGPNEYHVIILDNGRTAMLGGQFREMLRCIRCGACMNHCPVYAAVGGHTYGWVYPGPMGAVLTPSIVGIENAGHLPNASTFCGRCEEVCPVRIPLPKLMRHWREREFERHLSPATVRTGLAAWGFLATRPRLYAVAMSLFVFGARADGKTLRPLPLAAARRLMDAASRFSRARCADLPGAVEAAGEDAMTARATLFASIRQSLGVTGDEPARRAAVAERLKQHPRGVIPARGQLPPAGARQTVRRDGRGRGRHRRDSARAPPTCPPPSRRCCAGITCRCKSAAATIRGSPRCRGTRQRTLEVSTGASDGHQLVSVSHAFAGVAETGTLVMASGPDNPTTLNFLPDTHIVVVDAKDIAGDYETVWARVREKFGIDALPRAINMITGPSRSADIAQILILGAHGPRRLHVLIVGEAA